MFKLNENYILRSDKQSKHVVLVDKTDDYLFLLDFENSNMPYISSDYVIELDENGKIENKKESTPRNA